MIPTHLHKTLIFRALKRLKVWEDAEDAVQSAYLLYLKYQGKLDTSNPERLINWLVDQEVIGIWKKNNGITSTKKVHGKMLKFEDIKSWENVTSEEEVIARASYFAYNEGEVLYDGKVLKATGGALYAKSQYLGESYAEKEFGLTETLQNTKYGVYVRLALSSGTPRKYKQIRCYKPKV
jgi:hypothetical protein